MSTSESKPSHRPPRPEWPARRAGLALGVALVLSACCLHRRGYPAPGAAELARAAWSPQGAGIKSLRARAKVDQFTRKGRIKVRVFLLAARGGKLRFEAVSPLDTTLLTLTSDGRRFVSLDHRAGRVITGQASACAVAQVFGLALRPDQVLGVLTGQVPLLPAPVAQTLVWDACRAMERLELRSADGRVQRVWLRRVAGQFRPERSEVRDKGGALVLSIQFDGFRRIGGRQVPGRVRLERPAKHTDVILRYDKLELDVAVPEAAFELSVPPGLPEGVLDCP